MNAEELRKLSADATERKKREAQEAQRKAAEEEQKRQRGYHERCWEHARKIVMELDATVRHAASEGKREVHLYSLNSSKEIPVEVRCVRGIFSQVTDPCKKHRYSYQVPDYAQYVYDNCVHLNPRWVAGSTNPPCYRGGKETCTAGHAYLFLYVSW